MAKRREIVLQKRSGKMALWPELLLLLLGALGLLLLLLEVPGLSFAGWVVYPASALLCVGLWYSRRKGKGVFWAAWGVSVLLTAIGGFFFREELAGQFRHIGGLFLSQSAPAPADTTGAVLLLFVAFLLLLFLIEHRWFSALLAMALPVLAVLAGIPVGPLPLALLFLWFIGSWAFWGLGDFPCPKGFSFTTVVIAAALLLAWPISTGFFTQLGQPAYWAEETAYRVWRGLSGTASDPYTDGSVSRGNRYLTGAVQMEITTSRRPSETIYLRGFSGGEYQKGEWAPADDAALLQEVKEILDWGNWSNMVDGMYRTMYYVVNREMIWETPPVPISITIRYNGNQYPNHFAPYYSRLTSDWLTVEDGYTCEFYEPKDMQLDWENVPDHFAMQRDWNRRVHKTYAQLAPAAYTGVPRESLLRLVRLAEEHPLRDMDEITAFILDTLHNGAAYSQTPGWTPMGEDVVEDFLFEKHSGYCVHYASAAVLLYRLYGIPARYAAGYLVPPEEFSPGEDGNWTAAVTDEAAHAWAEIFLPDHGWTPVEVTPNSQGEMEVHYPGFTWFSSHLPQWEPALAFEGGERPEAPVAFDSPSRSPARPEPQQLGVLWGYLGFCAVLFLLLAADARRVEKLRRLDLADCRELFGHLLAAFRFCGILTDLNGTEADFPQRASEAIPAVSLADWNEAVQIISAAAYGQEGPEPDGDAFVRKVYRRAVREMFRRLPWSRKLIFRFGKGFL